MLLKLRVWGVVALMSTFFIDFGPIEKRFHDASVDLLNGNNAYARQRCPGGDLPQLQFLFIGEYQPGGFCPQEGFTCCM